MTWFFLLASKLFAGFCRKVKSTHHLMGRWWWDFLWQTIPLISRSLCLSPWLANSSNSLWLVSLLCEPSLNLLSVTVIFSQVGSIYSMTFGTLPRGNALPASIVQGSLARYPEELQLTINTRSEVFFVSVFHMVHKSHFYCIHEGHPNETRRCYFWHPESDCWTAHSVLSKGKCRVYQ